MPANLPPEYFEIERTLRAAKTPQEKIEIYEKLLSIIPKHKGTEKLQALYKTKMAKLKDDLQRRPAAARRGPTHRVEKSGAGQIVFVGPPNAGKSKIIRELTGVDIEVADYPFTTRAASPYMMPYRNIRIQLVDAPPMTSEYMETWFPETVKAADAVCLVADLGDPDGAAVTDGIIRRLAEKRIEFAAPETEIPTDKFPFLKKTLLVANKTDLPGAADRFEEMSVLLEGPFARTHLSALTGEGLEDLRRKFFDLLGIVRVYSKIPGKKPDKESPFTLRKGSTVMDMARAVHKDFKEKLNYARVWNSRGLDGLRVTRDYLLEDEDTVELHL